MNQNQDEMVESFRITLFTRRLKEEEENEEEEEEEMHNTDTLQRIYMSILYLLHLLSLTWIAH